MQRQFFRVQRIRYLVGMCCMHYLVLVLLHTCFIQRISSYTFNKQECNYKAFYEPYLRVSKVRSGSPKYSQPFPDSVSSNGFLDLRHRNGILCMNGPVFLYTTLTLSGSLNIFAPDPADINMYNNECVTFNIRELPNGMTELPPLTPESDDVKGLKLFGAYLFGKEEDYRSPNRQFFQHNVFGHFNAGTQSQILGASFAFTVVPNNKLQTDFCPPENHTTTTPAPTQQIQKRNARSIPKRTHIFETTQTGGKIFPASPTENDFSETVEPKIRIFRQSPTENDFSGIAEVHNGIFKGTFEEQEIFGDIPTWSRFVREATTCSGAPTKEVPGQSAFCLAVKSNKTILVFSPPSNIVPANVSTGVVCTLRTEGDLNAYFTPNTPLYNFEWIECTPDDLNSISKKEQDAPDINPLNDFRIINPKDWTKEGTQGKLPKPGYPGYVVNTLPFFKPPTYETFPFPGYYFPKETKKTNDPQAVSFPRENYTSTSYDITDCEQIPEPENCDDDSADEGCVLLNQVMFIKDETVEENNVQWHPNLPDVPDGDALKKLTGSWRVRAIRLVEDIYKTVCPQVPQYLAPAITRIVEYYLHTKLKTSTELDKWNSEKLDQADEEAFFSFLESCNESNAKLEFRRIRRLEEENRILELEGTLTGPTINQESLNELQTSRALRFPFDTVFRKVGEDAYYTTPEYLEAAQVDYDMNWAIDTFWKMLVTVSGFCQGSAPSPTISTLSHVLPVFEDHIFNFLNETWVNEDESSSDNKVFDQLFGEYIHEMPSVFIDMCMDSSYGVGDPVARPPRKIELRKQEGLPSTPGSTESRPNYFILTRNAEVFPYASSNT